MTTPNNKQAGERMRYSSGKWNAANRDDGMFVEAHPDFNDGHAICECFGPDAVANARLIAAAPEFYKAAKDFVDYYSGNRVAQLGNGQARKSLDAFRAAIAKAEGRAS